MFRPVAIILLLSIWMGGCGKPVDNSPLAQGKALFMNGKWDEAIEKLSAAIAQNPHDSQAYLYRGQSYIAKGSEHSSMAIADYTEAIRLNPDDCEAYYNRAIAFREKGENQKALHDDMIARRLDPAAQRTGKMYSTTPDEFRRAVDRAADKETATIDEEIAKEDSTLIPDYHPETISLPPTLSERMKPSDDESATSSTPSNESEEPDRYKAYGQPRAAESSTESLTEKMFGKSNPQPTTSNDENRAKRPLPTSPPVSPLSPAPPGNWNVGTRPAAPLPESAESRPPARPSPVGALPFGNPYQSRGGNSPYSPYSPYSQYGSPPTGQPYAPYSPYGGSGARSTGIQSQPSVPQVPYYNPRGSSGSLPTPAVPYGR